MTKRDWANRINSIIQNDRNEFARKMEAEAYVNEHGLIRYRDKAKGYARRISFAELLSHLHGEDIRAIRGTA